MRRFTALASVGILLGALTAGAWADYLIQPADTWTFVNASASTWVGDVTGFELPGYDDSAWFTGNAPFSSDGGGDFAFQTYWQPDFDPALRKTIFLATPVDAEVGLGVDNGFSLYVNGTLVASENAEGYTSRWEYNFTIPASAFVSGDNLIAIQLEDHGGATAFDMQMTPEPASLVLLVAGLVLLRRR